MSHDAANDDGDRDASKGDFRRDTIVAHKTGTTAVVINDAGIITLPPDSKIAGRLVLVVYVADGSRIAAMERTVAQMSAAAFEFFTGRSDSTVRPAWHATHTAEAHLSVERVRFGEPDAERRTGDAIEIGLRTDQMEGPVHVRVLLPWGKAQRGRGRFQLVERAERRLARRGRTIVVAVDDVALERLALNLPHRVDVARRRLRDACTGRASARGAAHRSCRPPSARATVTGRSCCDTGRRRERR